MYSKAKFAGHPIHPMLVAFPITSYVACCVFYIIYAANAQPFWFQVAYIFNWVGVISAAVAAVPGFIDWAFGIPSHSAAKATGLAHAAFNVIALVLFLACAIINSGEFSSPMPAAKFTILLPILGVVFTVAEGFLGWELIARHHVGVDLTREQEEIEHRRRAG